MLPVCPSEYRPGCGQTIHNPAPDLLEQVLEAKKSIQRLRRMTAHQRLILESLPAATSN